MKKLLSQFLITAMLLQTACSEDNILPVDDSSPKTIEKDSTVIQDEPLQKNKDSSGIVKFLNEELVEDGLVLINDAGNNRVYLMDKSAKIHHEWKLTSGLGNDVFLLPNGKLLASLEADEPQIELGGSGGKLQLIDKDGKVEWNFDYSSEDRITHHDAELLPNGNIIALVWERINVDEAMRNGSKLETDLFTEAIIEINPESKEIVWEWRAWDHIVQDIDDAKNSFGIISKNPQLIDLNYVDREDGDIMHANGIAYDQINDLIHISVNFYHEVWVIDHSTSTEVARGHTGGTFGKGGDLIYRFGNPMAYQNPNGKKLFYSNHFPNLLQGEDLGKMLIFSNGTGLDQSTVYELKLPQTFTLEPNTDNEPEVAWSFTNSELFAPKVSGAVKLPNGNRLITEGDFGIWEVTESGEVVWKFSSDGFFWRAYHYDKDAPEILSLKL